MTRIIAGSAGGRALHTPKGDATRPTTDRVREAMFSRLESLLDFTDARVLDLYAGSGALGLEAASRGAAHVLCVESDRATAALIGRNAASAGLPMVNVRTDRVDRTLARGPELGAYDLVVADPPYWFDEVAIAGMLGALMTHEWLSAQAVVVLERSSRSPHPRWPAGLGAMRSKKYGETMLHDAERSLNEESVE